MNFQHTARVLNYKHPEDEILKSYTDYPIPNLKLQNALSFSAEEFKKNPILETDIYSKEPLFLLNASFLKKHKSCSGFFLKKLVDNEILLTPKEMYFDLLEGFNFPSYFPCDYFSFHVFLSLKIPKKEENIKDFLTDKQYRRIFQCSENTDCEIVDIPVKNFLTKNLECSHYLWLISGYNYKIKFNFGSKKFDTEYLNLIGVELPIKVILLESTLRNSHLESSVINAENLIDELLIKEANKIR